ncbi:MAG: FecR domain-containing protein [Bryobacteraceae bacterium]|nr:FecR domain-containing protein [Bryobacteraceae bacterium]
MFDRAIEDIRNESVDAGAVKAAAQRAWARVSQAGASLNSCDDFQALIPDYRVGRLNQARMLLVKDHLGECIACRKVYMGRAEGPRSHAAPSLSWPLRWAIAAALAITAGAAGWYMFQQFGGGGREPAATVAYVNGPLYRLAADEAQPIGAGAAIRAGEPIRVGNASGATIRLRDGSTVEARQRSDFSVIQTRSDVTIRLTRGSVIVEAAKRRNGHLYVSTPDCRVAVTGTVFSVNSGVKGSRVSVIEGEVHVNHGGRERILHAGDQYASTATLAQVPVEQEIAWSRKADEHIALLGEFKRLGEAMERAVSLPDARYASALLNYLPRDTAIYAAIPNLAESLAQAEQVFEQRLSESAALRQWWEEKNGADSANKLRETIDEIRRLGAYLGDEIVIAAALDAEGKLGDPVILAELKQSGFAEFLQAEAGKHGGSLRLYDSAADIAPAAGDLLVYARPNIAAASTSVALLRTVAAAIEGQAAGSLAGTPFHAQVAEAYRDGVGLLFCADLQRIIPKGDEREMLGNVGGLVVSQKMVSGKPDTHAVLTFRGNREGIASWLADPAPVGALDFVSPDATVAFSFVAKDLTKVVDELASKVPGFTDGLAGAERELGVNIRNDLAASLGGEFVFAWDGPAIPTPSWKAVAEVNNPGALQGALLAMVNSLNQKAAQEGKPLLETSQEMVGGRAYYSITSPAFKPFTEMHYVFIDGYLVAAPSRALLDKAIQNRAAGNVLASSPKFTSLLPRDAQPNFSAMAYHNMTAAAGAVSGALTPEQQKALAEFAQPTLVMAYASNDRIAMATAGEAFALTPGNLFGLKTPLGLSGMLESGKGRRDAKEATKKPHRH